MKILGFIPARGGSKGIPRKNLAQLNGKPLIQYTIEAAKASSFLSDIFLSTDDEEILAFGGSLGLSTDYLRPKELAGDRSQISDCAIHAVDWLAQRGVYPDVIVLLQPTSPLRKTEDIDGAVRQFLDSCATTLISVNAMLEHPFECIHATGRNWNWLAQSPTASLGRQEYDSGYFFINGAIYIVTIDFLRTQKRFIDEGNSDLFLMPRNRGLDIDDPEHMSLAEFILKRDA